MQLSQTFDSYQLLGLEKLSESHQLSLTLKPWAYTDSIAFCLLHVLLPSKVLLYDNIHTCAWCISTVSMQILAFSSTLLPTRHTCSMFEALYITCWVPLGSLTSAGQLTRGCINKTVSSLVNLSQGGCGTMSPLLPRQSIGRPTLAQTLPVKVVSLF